MNRKTNRNLVLALAGVALVTLVNPVLAANRPWNKNGDTGSTTRNLNDAANWTGGAPTNGDDAFLIWNRGAAGPGGLQTVTNSTANIFIANSLSITNANTSDKGSITVVLSGQTFLTNGLGALNFAGTTGPSDIGVTFNGNLTAKLINVTGGGGSGSAALTLAGATSADSLVFNGGAGTNRLAISGSLNLGGALIVTNLNANSFGTLSGNATVGQLRFNNAATNRFLITGSTTTVTGAVESVVGGFTLANNATLTIGSLATVTFSNVGPLIRGTVNVNGGTLGSKLAWTNSSFIALGSGFITGVPFVNTGSISGSGTITPNFSNLGTVAANAPGLNFAGVLTNTGWIAVNVTTARFANAVVNSGTMSFNPGVAFFGANMTLESSGVIAAAPGSELHFQGDFINNSTRSNAVNLATTALIFDGPGGNNTQHFTVAGVDLGASYAGFTNNFAVGSLNVGGSASIVQLLGTAGHALYVKELTVFDGATLLLNGLTIYTEAPAVLNGLVITDGGSIVVIPEPSALALVGCSMVLLMVARRYRK